MMNFRLPALTALLLLTAYYNCGPTQKSAELARKLEAHKSTIDTPAAALSGDRFTAADFEQHIARLR
ncbi:MAG: hypothetical protein ICV68_06830, partial [Pyrinomonadaceae bacterium]|nr:hypothetical protein [Pyrinomonadaceae bacterium]